MEIKIYRYHIEYNFSFNELLKRNKRGQNISLTEIKKTIEFLSSYYLIDPSASLIINLEIGFNYPNINTDFFIHSIIGCRTMDYKRNYHLGRGDEIAISSSYIQIKIYDKGRHIGDDELLARIEIKMKKSYQLRKLRVTTLDSLLNETTIKNCFQYFIKCMGNLTTVNPELITEEINREQIFVNKCMNGYQWGKTGDSGRSCKRYNTKRKLKTLHKKAGLPMVNEIIIRKSEQIFNEFICDAFQHSIYAGEMYQNSLVNKI